ncbi:unannotated protein [freshwater metagenome]|uniref:Unannotated protein n=1 Tax=freshwater metagenome TaxID=449393 RepID=A0A6J7XV28_9ZZZZ
MLLVAPTVIALSSLDGEELHASCGLPAASPLPAATPKTTPAATAAATALFTDVLLPPPRLMLATIGMVGLLIFCWATQLIPEMTPAHEPDPAQSSTRTGIRVTFLATPYVVPPIVPAT